MARGLSDLQKNILAFAQASRDRGKNLITSGEILAELWGWKNQETVAHSEYNTAHASLSRALTRLWQRGLVEIWKSMKGSATGITLVND